MVFIEDTDENEERLNRDRGNLLRYFLTKI